MLIGILSGFFNCVFPNYSSFQMQSQWVLLLGQVLPLFAHCRQPWCLEKKPIRSSVSTFAIGYNLPKIAQKYTFRPILQIYWQKKETFSSNIRLVFKNNSCIGHYLVLCCCPKVVLTVLLKKQVLDNRWRLLVPRHKNFDSCWYMVASSVQAWNSVLQTGQVGNYKNKTVNMRI